MWIYGSFFSSSTLLMRLLLFVIMFCCDCECVCVCVYVCICVCVQANTTLQPSKLIVLSLSDNIKATTKCRKLIYIQQQKHLCSPKYMWHLYFENKIMHNRVVNVVKVNIKVRKHSHFNFYSLCQDQSTVAQQAEMTMAECSLTSWLSARFWIASHTMLCGNLSGGEHCTLLVMNNCDSVCRM